MCVLILLFVTVFFCDKPTLGLDCDKTNVILPEGIAGQLSFFPWLGILRVHLHEGDSYRIAVTGLIVIKDNFAIANANDIVKIPRTIFKQDTQAMFIRDTNKLWFCKVRDYIAHPEFEILSINTIALLELYKNQDEPYNVIPRSVCWPFRNYNTSTELYVVGYTDENKLLEKTIYKLQYVEKTKCDEFYLRSNLTEEMQIPMRYQCAYALNIEDDCVWDNGMAVVSNASGYWVIIGVTVQGPGCAAPVRFIDMNSYLPWIITAVTLDAQDIKTGQNDLALGRRRSAFGEGFKIRYKDNLPIHTLFRSNPDSNNITWHDPNDDTPFNKYNVTKDDNYPPEYFNVIEEPKEGIILPPSNEQLNVSEKIAEYYTGTGEDSCQYTDICYKESTIIRDQTDSIGYGIYSIVLNYEHFNVTCVRIKMKCLSFKPMKFMVDFDVVLTPSPESQIFLKKVKVPRPKLSQERPDKTSKWRDDLSFDHLNKEDHATNKTILITVRFKFYEKAELTIELTGQRLSKLEKKRKYPDLMSWRKSGVNKNAPKIMNSIEKMFWSGENVVEVGRSYNGSEIIPIKEIAEKKKQEIGDEPDQLQNNKKESDGIQFEEYEEYSISKILNKRSESTTNLPDSNESSERSESEEYTTTELNEVTIAIPNTANNAISRGPTCRTILLFLNVFAYYYLNEMFKHAISQQLRLN